MPQFVKRFLNNTTMYRLMLYYLIVLWVGAIIFSIFSVLPYKWLDIFVSGAYLFIICNLSNYLLSKILNAKTNLESASITALILTLLAGPLSFFENILTLSFVGVFAMASKYVLVVRKKHIFNPAAIAVLASAYIVGTGASWWYGSMQTLPLIIIGGFFVLYKIRRFMLVGSFFSVYVLSLLFFGSVISMQSFLIPSLWFFMMVMLVEPLTSPSTRNKQVVFGSFVAVVYVLLSEFVSGYAYGLETALIMGNILNMVISPSFNLLLTFQEKKKVAHNTWSFYFEPMSDISFTPGQYMEWTYPHKNPDSRGVRRYFTVSSAPDEKRIAFTMRVSEKGSSFKSALMKIKKEDTISASNPHGDFTLPKDKSVPLVFIAGGIGITPFRSMIKHMISTNENRDVVLMYSNKTEKDIAFKNLFEKAKKLGVQTFHIVTEKDGHIDADMINDKIPDYKKRMFYVSGPHPMVESIKKILDKLNVEKIKTDFFPGYTGK